MISLRQYYIALTINFKNVLLSKKPDDSCMRTVIERSDNLAATGKNKGRNRNSLEPKDTYFNELKKLILLNIYNFL